MGIENKQANRTARCFIRGAYPTEERAALFVYPVPPRVEDGFSVQMWFPGDAVSPVLPPPPRCKPLWEREDAALPGVPG